MASSDSELQLVVRAVDEASATLNKVRSEIGSFSKGAESDISKISSASDDARSHISGIGGELAKIAAVVGIGVVTKQFMDFGISSASALQGTSTNMQLLIGNTQQANKVMGDLYNFSRGTPFAFPDVANAAKTLLQFGATADNVVGITQMLGNVVAVTGTNYQNLAQVYGEVNAAGKVQMNNTNQLIQDGVPIMQAMAKVTGKSMTDVQDAMLKGGVSANVFDAAIRSIAPPDALNKMADDLTTKMSSLQGSLRSVAFEILGINIDPIRGFVVQAGGLFDQLVKGVGELAKRLRDPDIQNAMGALGQMFSAMASVVIPLLFEAFSFLGQHLRDIIPWIAAIGVAFGVIQVGQFIGSMLSAAAAIIPFIAEASPLILILGVLAAVAGVSVLGALNNMMQGIKNVAGTMGNTTQAVKQGSADIGSGAQDGLGKAGQAADDLSKKLADISRNVLQANDDFKSSLADIVASHDSKIADLKSQIASEQSDFSKAQQQKTDDFKQSQVDQQQAHQDSVDQISRQLEDEQAKGRFANLKTVQDLQDRLKKENDSYNAQVAKNQATYDKDTENAKEASDDKLSKLSTQLKTETDFMLKHAADLQGIRASDAKDEIDKLKQSHDRQIASLDRQKSDALASAGAAAVGVSDTWKAAADNLAKDSKFATTGTKLGSAMADGMTSEFSKTWNTFWDGMGKYLDQQMKGFDPSKGFQAMLNHISIPGGLPTFLGGQRAAGGPVDGGVPYLVGEDGPEIFMPSSSGSIVPNNKIGSAGGAGTTIYNTWNVHNGIDVSAVLQQQAWTLRNA